MEVQASGCFWKSHCSAVLFVDAVALLTTVSKRHTAYGVVRVSARMVGIVLNSCSQRQNSKDLHLSLRFVLSERRRREFE